MTGSGLDDLIKTVYDPGTIPHIMSGHSYSRAFQAHLSASSALLLTFLDDNPTKLNEIDNMTSFTWRT